MALTPGSKIDFADLAAIATTANAKTSLSKLVSPLYNDAGGHPWGHRRFSGVAITAEGAGYKCGDVLSIGFSSACSVVCISGAGGVLGIRIVDPGQGAYAATAASPIAATGGSGTGCQLSFSSFAQYGPTSDYVFPDQVLNRGQVTGYYLVDGGSGYAVGNALTMAEQPGAGLTVATVDGSGKILTVSMSATTSAQFIPDTIKSMAAIGGAGTGAKFGGYFTLAQNPKWLTELNRLRADVYNCGKFNQSETVSGPWPTTGLTNAYATDVEDAEFFYEDNGTAQSMSVYAEGRYASCNEMIANIAAGNLSIGIQYSSFSIDLIIGGDKQVILNGYFEIDIYNSTSAAATVAASGSFPGLNFQCGLIDITGTVFTPLTPSAVNGQTNRYISMVTNLAIDPGTYTVQINVTNGCSTYSGFAPPDWRPVIDYGLTATYTEHTSAPAPGIHSTAPVRKIVCPKTPGGVGFPVAPSGNGFPFGIWSKAIWGEMGYTIYTRKKYITDYPDPGNVYGTGKAFLFWQSGQVKLTASCNGFFSSKTSPLANPLCCAPIKYPWNYLRTKYGSISSVSINPFLLGDLAPNSPANVAQISNSYDQTLPVENQPEPASWLANRYFTVGFSIMDSNGNMQIVTVAGVSGSTAPGWATQEGVTTTDGAATWNCWRVLVAPAGNVWGATAGHGVGWAITDSNGHTQVCVGAGITGSAAPIWGVSNGSKTTDGTITWEMRTQIVPTPHRPTCLGRYPFYWASETDPRLKPPTSTSGLTIWGAYNQWRRNIYNSPSYNNGWQQDNLAKGWWIYSVSIRRCAIASGEVSVTIGCMRSGSFVAFGTWDTGQTIQVLWPIFTSDALVYQCAERVDIQAVAIASGGVGVTVGPLTVDFPIFGAFAADTAAILALIP